MCCGALQYPGAVSFIYEVNCVNFHKADRVREEGRHASSGENLTNFPNTTLSGLVYHIRKKNFELRSLLTHSRGTKKTKLAKLG